MKKKYLILLALVLVFAMLLPGCGGGAAEGEGEGEVTEPIIMKISHVGAPDTERDRGAQKIKEIVEEKSGGRIEAQIYPSSQLGGQRDQVEGVQFGNIEMSIVPTSYLGSSVPMITLLDTPYLLPTDPDQLTELYESDAIKRLMDQTLEKDMRVLGIWQTGYKVWTANKPLLYPEDAAGLKARVMNSPIMFKQDEVLGMSAITMDFGETYAALQNKAIDAQENPIPLNYDMKFTEVQSDMTITNHAGLDQLVIVSTKWFEGLDEDLQAIIAEAVEEGGKVCKQATLDKIDEYTEIILADGSPKIHYLNEEQLQAWKDALAPVKDFARETQDDLGKEIFDAIVAESDRITSGQ